MSSYLATASKHVMGAMVCITRRGWVSGWVGAWVGEGGGGVRWLAKGLKGVGRNEEGPQEGTVPCCTCKNNFFCRRKQNGKLPTRIFRCPNISTTKSKNNNNNNNKTPERTESMENEGNKEIKGREKVERLTKGKKEKQTHPEHSLSGPVLARIIQK